MSYNIVKADGSLEQVATQVSISADTNNNLSTGSDGGLFVGGGGGESSADKITFSDTKSSLSATNVQDAIDNTVEKLNAIPTSHIGMIIHSTTLDTMEKVIAIYGGTTWTKIEGRFLLGQSSSYDVNSTGGSKDAIIPYHRHSVPALSGSTDSKGYHNHNMKNGNTVSAIGGNTISAGSNYGGLTLADNTGWYLDYAGAHTHTVTTTANNTGYEGTSGNTTNANMPPYKTVYIWERTA